jgi:two-component system, chemotaxis family, sensor kinase CheA
VDDLLRDFLTESAENLGKLDNDIVELERRPTEAALLNGVFRTIHTIKGTCGFLALERLERVAHAAENVLDAVRSGKLAVSSAIIGDILAATDCIKLILDHLEQTEAEPEGDDSKLIACLEQWLGAAAAPTDDAPEELPADVPPPLPYAADAVHPESVVAEPAAPNASPPSRVTDDRRTAPRRADDAEPEPRASVSDSTLRVGVGLLDQLMNLVGELALGRNQLMQLAAANEDSEFAQPVQRVTSDLLEAVMKTRMQPIGNAWTKLPRLVRDLASASGKQLSLEMHGAETELDRQILQAIQDPLTHMIRNSADHGVEATAIRRAAGKSDHGTITLSARHEGGHVVIEIRDDGAGISAAKVRRKAIERGLVKADAAEAMPDAAVLRLVFEPGFSTAEQITNVSGRGVGMDVVRSNIELIGGSVELTSQEGRGTTVRVKIPLTLAIISALLVGTAGETFAVPQIGVVELVRVTEEQRGLIETIHGAQFYRLRDSLLPLVFLHKQLGLNSGPPLETYNIIVCQVGETRFGLVVAEVFDTQDIVVKPVGRMVKHLSAYAGCTITGDGRVIMILDTSGIATAAKISANEAANEASAASERERVLALSLDNSRESILLFDAGYPALQAVPLSLVARLEEFPLAAMEEADGHVLVQYRGALIPVLPAHPGMDLRAMDPRPVIVFSDRDRTMGVAVNEIRDIVEERIVVQRAASRPGVLGVCVIGERATEIIDTDFFLRQAHADWFNQRADHDGQRAPSRVLLVDDSRFFLGLVSPVVRSAGYDVLTAADGRDALARLDRGEHFDVVVSDIDMDHTDGLALATAIRANPRWATMSLVALTARGAPEDRARGLSAGFDEYLTKFDRDELLTTLNAVLHTERVAA